MENRRELRRPVFKEKVIKLMTNEPLELFDVKVVDESLHGIGCMYRGSYPPALESLLDWSGIKTYVVQWARKTQHEFYRLGLKEA